MVKNREIKMLLIGMIGVTIFAVTVAAIIFSSQVALFVGMVTFLFIGVYLLFTWWRYREIKKLSYQLHRISNGEYRLDVRDNKEGELSILKNDIYKVTSMLSEQRSHLQKEKGKLSEAISDISHQLKTPLTSMIVMVDLLRDPHLDEKKRQEFTNNINVQLERMEWLVSSLLKLSKIDAGTILFKKDKVYVKDLVETVAHALAVPMDIKQQTFSVTGDEKATFIGDFHWSREALINILKNCVEHTHEGGTITVHYSENALYTEIVISDNGKGILKEDLPYIFQRFYKGKHADTDSVGIGLAMSHSIITNQQGDIAVHSEIGKGTTFTIKFYKQVI